MMRDGTAQAFQPDEEGRIVIHIGGKCPECGAGPDIKYSGCGRAVVYHTPVTCQAHMRHWKARNARARYPAEDTET
jgi:hypothetical protein